MLSDEDFTAWLESLGVDTKTKDISRLVDQPLSPAHAHAKPARSRVAVALVVEVARALSRDPVGELATFPGFHELGSTRPPSEGELLSQLQPEDIMVEVLKRRRASLAHQLAGYALSQFPFAESTRQWFNSIDRDGTLRRSVAEETGTKLSNLSRAIGENALSPQQILAASRHAGVSPLTGFVLSGKITSAEAGWSPTARENALLECSDSTLVTLNEQHAARLVKLVQAASEEELYWKTLG